MKLKVNHGNENYEFEYGVVSVVILFEEAISFQRSQIIIFLLKTIFYFIKFDTSK